MTVVAPDREVGSAVSTENVRYLPFSTFADEVELGDGAVLFMGLAGTGPACLAALVMAEAMLSRQGNQVFNRPSRIQRFDLNSQLGPALTFLKQVFPVILRARTLEWVGDSDILHSHSELEDARLIARLAGAEDSELTVISVPEQGLETRQVMLTPDHSADLPWDIAQATYAQFGDRWVLWDLDDSLLTCTTWFDLLPSVGKK